MVLAVQLKAHNGCIPIPALQLEVDFYPFLQRLYYSSFGNQWFYANPTVQQLYSNLLYSGCIPALPQSGCIPTPANSGCNPTTADEFQTLYTAVVFSLANKDGLCFPIHLIPRFVIQT
jgi:hypothetical protein